MASIEQLKGMITSKGGMARSNLFKVTLPNSVPGASAYEVNLLCANVQIPGRQVTSRAKSVGQINEEMAYGFLNGEISMTFLVLNDYGIRTYFEEWQKLAVDQTTYEVGFSNEYKKDMQIYQLKKGFGSPVNKFINQIPKIGPFDLRSQAQNLLGGTLDNFAGGLFGGPTIFTANVYGAFPKTVNAIDLSNELDGLVQLSVSFAFTNWQAIGSAAPGFLGGLANTAIGTVTNRLFT
jgi:hypothetical protein